MPTDDDYGRRERLLSHQHPSSTLSSSSSSSTSDCYHKQSFSPSPSASSIANSHQDGHRHHFHEQRSSSRYQQQQLSSGNDRMRQHLSSNNGVSNSAGEYANASVLTSANSSNNPFSSETFPSPPSPAPANDRFVPPPPLSPSPSEKYSSSQSLAGYPGVNRLLSSSSSSSRELYNSTSPSSISPVSTVKERFSSSERLLAAVSSSPSVSDDSCKEQQQQRYVAASSTDRLLNSTSSVLENLSSNDRCAAKDAIGTGSSHYNISSERMLSSSPIHAPVPERFAGETNNDRYCTELPAHNHDRFVSIAVATERYATKSPNVEGAQQARYSSTANPGSETIRRYSSTDRVLEAQKYAERPSSSPAPSDFSCRLQSSQDSGGCATQRYLGTNDRYGDMAVHKYSQARPNDRFSTGGDRFVHCSATGHDPRQSNGEVARYTTSSSTERLLSSSSPAPSEINRSHQQNFTSGNMVLPTVNDRYGTLPLSSSECKAAHNNTNYGSSSKASSDKYHHHQLSKTVQSYNNERYDVTSQGEQFERCLQERYSTDRFSGSASDNERSQNNERSYHATTERYSPVRGNTDKYLSLPKPKDRYSSASDRSYNAGNTYVPPAAHTPVERYVPQPSPESLYPPDRYVERYVPPSAHQPADRYVPSTEPGDSFMRRDLGFHHHYRLQPTSYPYHQNHFQRLRNFSYQSSGRIGGSPGSSSSSSTASVQRDGYSTSPLLRQKVRTAPAEFTQTSTTPRHISDNPAACCNGNSNQKGCCQSVRRSLPPGALPAIPTQTNSTSSWQQSPNSGSTVTSTVSSCLDGESTQSMTLYGVDAVGNVTGESSGTTSSTASTHSAAMCPSNSNTNITRSASAPAGPRPTQLSNPELNHQQSSSNTNTTPRPKLKRNQSRTEAIKNYIKRETATFFGVDEESEAIERQKWLDRRRRMASRKYGTLLPEHRPPDPDITKDVPDAMEFADSATLRKWQRPVRRKDSVAKMTLSGIQYVVETLRRPRSTQASTPSIISRSFSPTVTTPIEQVDDGTFTDAGIDEEEAFFQKPSPIQALTITDESAIGERSDGDGQETTSTEVTSVGESDSGPRICTPPAAEANVEKRIDDRSFVDGQARRPRAVPRDHYNYSRKWGVREDPRESKNREDENLRPKTIVGGKRISPSTIDRIFDNSNRRQYGMGIVGRFFGRSFKKSIAQKPDVRKQLDDIEDHRPYVTYWVTTAQILIMIISLVCYGFGPVGFDLHHRSSLVLVTSLSLQQVEYQEPANFWIGPRAADLIHLGAKFAPCMRRDIKILKEIDVWREKERDTACCIRNDDSGCVQSSRAECSVRGMSSTSTNTISTWKKWGPADNGPGGRISGSVCGLDPKFCDAPASIAPYEWPDDITKWPICRKSNPFSQRFRSRDAQHQGNANFPVGRYKDKMAEHMICEVIGHPCCIGIHGSCRITTKEYCDFVHGYFHEEASLCSQIECLHDVCGMVPFLHPEWPDQFYRLFTSAFLHAGILHIAITLVVQYFLMRDLEKLTGSIRIALIYFIGATAGNLASAIFVPYRAEVGPAGAHFALLATLVVEVLHCWPMLKHPWQALTRLLLFLFLLLAIGLLPWVDNYAHLFGFIFGFLAAYALMPFVSFGHYDRRRKIIVIWLCLALIIGLFGLLLALFYSAPSYECEICKLFTCLPLTRDFCASQNINFKREEPV